MASDTSATPGPGLPVTGTQQPDGTWKVSWDEVDIAGFGATEGAATEDFVTKLKAAQSDPAVMAALMRLASSKPAEPPEPMPETTPAYAALPNVTAADFDAVIASETPVLVDFWASWCRPCLAMAPALVELQEEMGERLRVVKVDVEAERSLAERCTISAVPVLLLYRRGELLHRMLGARGIGDLRRELAPFLTDEPAA